MSFTLGVCVAYKKCRKGKATGTTRDGAYWLVCDPIICRRAGGDGIGNSSADLTYELELRHYRDGEVRAVMVRDAYHQNGSSRRYRSVPELLECRTVEAVIVCLKQGVDFENGAYTETVYSDLKEELLTNALVKLGLAECEQAPDEEDDD